jgi:hypothetical protein
LHLDVAEFLGSIGTQGQEQASYFNKIKNKDRTGNALKEFPI